MMKVIRAIYIAILPVLIVLSILLPAMPAHALSQVLYNGYYVALSAANTEYMGIANSGAVSTVESNRGQVVASGGIISMLYIELAVAPGGTTSRTFTLRVNGVNTELTCTIVGASVQGADTIHTVTVAAGDLVCISSVPTGSPAASAVQYSCIFTSTTTNQSLILGTGQGNPAATTYTPIGSGGGYSNVTEAYAYQIVGRAGTISKLYVNLSTNPGAAASTDAYRFTLRKGGVSTSLTCTITELDTTGSDIVNSVAVVSGDYVDLMIEALNVPANTPVVRFGMVYTPNIAGNSLVFGGSLDPLNAAATEYNQLATTDGVFSPTASDWTATEAQRQQLSLISKLTNLQVKLSGAPDNGAGVQSYTFSIRNNASDPAGTPSVTISEASTTGGDNVNGLVVAAYDNIDLKCVPSGTPTVRYAAWGAISYAGIEPIVSTGVSTGSGSSWAVVNGNLTSVGTTPLSATATVTQRGFDYGLTTIYGSSVVTSSTSYAIGAYNNILTGLLPATTYHYRAKAYNGLWDYGVDETFTTEGADTLFENFGDNTNSCGDQVHTNNFSYQSFTVGSQAHMISKVGLYLARTGSPGNMQIDIYRIAAGGTTPASQILSSDTVNANNLSTTPTWVYYDLATPLSLEPGGVYAIVLKALTGSVANYVCWYWNTSNLYAGGNAGYSPTGGQTWAARTANDYLFKVFGDASLNINDAKVFQSYISSGDWLVVCRYTCLYPPYYASNADVQPLFSLRLLTSSGTVLANTNVKQWGYAPGSIYISAQVASPLDWGSPYVVQIYGNFSPNPHAEYILQPADWMGSNLAGLDNWVLSTAGSIEQYYPGTTLSTYVAGKGKLLNSTGGVVFTNGIPQLSTIRPGIFQLSSVPSDYNPVTESQDFRDTMGAWQSAWGPDGTIMLTRFGNMLGVGGGVIGGGFFLMIGLVVVGFAFTPGHTTAATILMAIPVLSSVYFGVDIVFIAVLMILVAFLLFKQFWMDKGT